MEGFCTAVTEPLGPVHDQLLKPEEEVKLMLPPTLTGELLEAEIVGIGNSHVITTIPLPVSSNVFPIPGVFIGIPMVFAIYEPPPPPYALNSPSVAPAPPPE